MIYYIIIAHLRCNVNHQMAPAVYTFTVKRLWTALASAIAVVTFTNNCVAGCKVCYPRLPCCKL